MAKRVCSIFSLLMLFKTCFRQGMPSNPNKFGPLTNLPDYSYLDGRPVPLGMNQKRRMEKQMEYHQKILELSGDVDFAKDRYAKNQAEKAREKKLIIDSKLKRKGKNLSSVD